MAQNSLTIKGWAVTVVAALLAFGNKDRDRRFAFFAVYLTLVFWSLDTYYLMKERQEARFEATAPPRTLSQSCLQRLSKFNYSAV